MSQRQAALLRGINVGRAKRVAMADLRALFTDLGYSQVHPLLNSGNVVFVSPDADPAETSARVERALMGRLGLSVRVTVLTGSEFTRIVEENSLSDVADDPSRLLVLVLTDPGGRRLLEPLLKQDWSPEALALGQRAAYVWCPKGLLASRLAEATGRLLGDAVTTRNWSTIRKIHNLLEQIETK